MLATVAVQNEAYGESAPSPDDGQRLRDSMAAGSIVILPRVVATGEAAGAGYGRRLDNPPDARGF